MRRAAVWAFALVVLAGCTRSQEHYAVGPYPNFWYRQNRECPKTEYAGDLQVVNEKGKVIGYLRHERITLAGERDARDTWYVLDARFERVGMIGDKGGTFRFVADGSDWNYEKIGDMTPDAGARALLHASGAVTLIPATATPQPPAEAPKPLQPKPKEGGGS